MPFIPNRKCDVSLFDYADCGTPGSCADVGIGYGMAFNGYASDSAYTEPAETTTYVDDDYDLKTDLGFSNSKL